MTQAPSPTNMNNFNLATTQEIIAEAKEGRMVILVDDENRENEGDLLIPAEAATPDVINFMAKYGRGLICLALTKERIEQLGLSMMPQRNNPRRETGFTVSIEAREGISTGISAADRAHTIAVAVDPQKGEPDIVTPGHMFPLMARNGGVLVRAGHTEAAVDIARLAGFRSAGVICEIMNDDGSMARLPDLIKFRQDHNIKIGAIADLIAYRLRHDRVIEKTLETPFTSQYGGNFTLSLYTNKIEHAEHIALVCGDITTPEPVLVRMHAINILDDVLGDQGSGKAHALHHAMETIARAGRGVIVLLREPSPTSLSDLTRNRMGQAPGQAAGLRDYGVGAQILLDLGIRQMILLSSTRKNIVGLQGFGLEITEQRMI